MREHEVPTHVQAEDRVLLWFTFPQVVALVAVCALSYGAYHYVPGPSEVRVAVAVLLGLLGVAMVVGKIGNRRLPLVAADLLRYRLGARLYAGPVSQLVRSEPPAPVESGPGPLNLMARRRRRGARRLRVIARRTRRRLRARRRRDGERARRGERRPFRRHGWFGKRRQRRVDGRTGGNGAAASHSRRGKLLNTWTPVLAAVALTASASAAPQAAMADGHWPDEIEFEMPEPVPGRRVFVEGLSVSGDGAAVTLRAAAEIDLRVRAFGGSEGSALRFWGSARLAEGERIDYSLPLHGPLPSFTFSWEDELGQAGAVSLKEAQLPFPLPFAEGELCDLRMTSLGWTPGAVSGVVESECVTEIEEAVELQTVAGHESVIETALMNAEVTTIAGTVAAAMDTSQVSVPLVPDGETPFSLAVAEGKAIHALTVDVSLVASLSIPVPPLTQLTHHPERTEKRTETVSLYRPGTSETVSETVTVTHEDGTKSQHVVTATLSIPGETVHRDVTLAIVHPERVEAEVIEREPITGTREEAVSMASTVGADDPFQVLALPEPEPEDPPAEQTPGDDDLRSWFDRLGWEWPW
ncbi:MAG: hypothetical protein OXK21_10775 [Chloroflexota bacterium]|nr:hypothetical protein [Chloroflexota bacterium]